MNLRYPICLLLLAFALPVLAQSEATDREIMLRSRFMRTAADKAQPAPGNSVKRGNNVASDHEVDPNSGMQVRLEPEPLLALATPVAMEEEANLTPLKQSSEAAPRVIELRELTIVPGPELVDLPEGRNCGIAVVVSSSNCYGTGWWAAEKETGPAIPATRKTPLEKLSVTAWPNPASELVRFRLDDAAVAAYQVTLFDLTGKQLRTLRGAAGATTSINVADFPAGLYLFRVVEQETGRKFTGRFVVE